MADFWKRLVQALARDAERAEILRLRAELRDAVAALARVRAVPREPFEPNPDELGRAYIRGWQSAIAAIDAVLDYRQEEPRG
ncbi:hypothetical protein [Nonomuraea sp. bgisy101]|uniref:hypothetical protein n=1 Tax=Nonomuraea sp. bgisy101 TaxID=3413784 RepID=UPI003D71A9A9